MVAKATGLVVDISVAVVYDDHVGRGVGSERCVIGTVYNFNEWGVVVLDKGEDIIVRCG